MADLILEKITQLITNEKTYSGLFRAFVVLISLCLVAIGQGLPTAYENEREATKLKFEIEARFKSDLDKFDCTKAEERVADCRFAQYQMQTVGSGVDLLSTIIELGFGLGIICGVLAAAGFVSAIVMEIVGETTRKPRPGFEMSQLRSRKKPANDRRE